jgi:hypothetical protein
MAKVYRDCYARPWNEQEGVIMNMSWCHRHPPSKFIEYEEHGVTTVEGRCLLCGKAHRLRFRQIEELA